MPIGQAQRMAQLGSVFAFCSIAVCACGGAARLDGTPGGAAGAAGRLSAAGSGNSGEAGGAPGVAGTSSEGGGFSVAGASAAGSGGALDCNAVTCTVNCAPDEFVQWLPGSCCPRCQPQPPECLKGQAGFRQLLTTLTEEAGAVKCVNDADCTLLPSFAKCGDPCPGTPVSVTGATEITTELSQWEAANCSTCMALAVPCPAFPHPVCVDGTCLSYHPL